jgi:predicted membrane protein
MQLKALTKPKALTEIVAAILLIIFLVYPVAIPNSLAKMVESPLGMIIILSIALLLFIYSNKFLAIFFILVAYELIRRSSKTTGRSAYMQFTPTQEKRDQQMKEMNEPRVITLEEDVVSKMAPLGVSSVENQYIESTFRPVSGDVHNAFTL